jgi:hypothetical protein
MSLGHRVQRKLLTAKKLRAQRKTVEVAPKILNCRGRGDDPQRPLREDFAKRA